MQRLDPQQKGGVGEVHYFRALELPARQNLDDKTTIRFLLFIYIEFFIFHMAILAQWDSKVLGLNSANGLGRAGQWDPTPL